MEEEFVFQGRIAICEPVEMEPYHQYRIAGALICPDGQPQLSESANWENIQCEIIIRPLKRLGTMKIKNARLDHAALALGTDKEWENGDD